MPDGSISACTDTLADVVCISRGFRWTRGPTRDVMLHNVRFSGCRLSDAGLEERTRECRWVSYPRRGYLTEDRKAKRKAGGNADKRGKENEKRERKLAKKGRRKVERLPVPIPSKSESQQGSREKWRKTATAKVLIVCQFRRTIQFHEFFPLDLQRAPEQTNRSSSYKDRDQQETSRSCVAPGQGCGQHRMWHDIIPPTPKPSPRPGTTAAATQMFGWPRPSRQVVWTRLRRQPENRALPQTCHESAR